LFCFSTGFQPKSFIFGTAPAPQLALAHPGKCAQGAPAMAAWERRMQQMEHDAQYAPVPALARATLVLKAVFECSCTVRKQATENKR